MAEPNTRGKDTVDMARRQAAQICDQSNKYRSGVSMLLWQLCALLRKRLVCTLRLWSRLIHQLFIPVLLLAVFAYLLNRPPKRDYDKGFHCFIF
ncbi:unnamed protein product [Anisakis simplex]|uniref:Uncharacterized protein n=1 Tax=Anisakis simplex TaxID=6269 RepID=A0A0M3JIE0_ANISI|nr:unnamed protein product [Anisakis simplex]